jgi:uncharacterized protein
MAVYQRLIVLAVLLGSALMPASCLGQTASYAPLNCSKASIPAEKTICGTYELGQDEARLATLYGLLTSLVAMGQRGDIIDAQRSQWLRK